MNTHILVFDTLVNKSIILKVHPVDTTTSLRVDTASVTYVVKMELLEYPLSTNKQPTSNTRTYRFRSSQEALTFYNYLKDNLCNQVMTPN